jgi:hypothetical protein
MMNLKSIFKSIFKPIFKSGFESSLDSDFELFTMVFDMTSEYNPKELNRLRPLAKKTVKKFRPTRDDLLKVPVVTTKLKGINGTYDAEHDCVLIDENPTKPVEEIIYHELTHRRIERECKHVEVRFMYHMLLEFADHSNDDWLIYYRKNVEINRQQQEGAS